MKSFTFKPSQLAGIITTAVLITALFAGIFVTAQTETTITETSLLLTDGSNPMLSNLNMSQYQIVSGVFHKGSTPPTSPVEGQYFYDTDVHILYVYNSTAWVDCFEAGSGVTDHGALTGLTDDDHTIYLLANGTRVMSGDLNLSQNEILDAIIHSSSTAPSVPTEGQVYYDTDDHLLYVWNSTDWLSTSGGAAGPAGATGTIEGLPYSYTVFINATATYMINGTTGITDFSSTNETLVINSALGNLTVAGGAVLVKVGTYILDCPIIINGNSIELIGEVIGSNLGYGANYGVVFECKSSDAIQIDHAAGQTVSRFVTIKNIGFISDSSAGHGITTDALGASDLIDHLIVEGCVFQSFTTASKYAVNLKNFEGCTIKNNKFCYCGSATARSIYAWGENYNAGHLYIYDNYFQMEAPDVSWYSIELEATGTASIHSIFFDGNDFYTNSGYHSGGILLTPSANRIMYVRISDCDFERNSLTLDDGTSYVDDLIVTKTRFTSGANNAVLVLLGDGGYITRLVRIHNCDFINPSAHTGIVGIDSHSSTFNSAAPCIIRDNYFEGAMNEIYASNSQSMVYNNIGYNPVGIVSTPITGAYMIDSGAGAVANATTYTCWGSPKTVSVYGGTVSSIIINSATVFVDTGHSIELNPKDTFSIVWSDSPTVIVVAH